MAKKASIKKMSGTATARSEASAILDLRIDEDDEDVFTVVSTKDEGRDVTELGKLSIAQLCSVMDRRRRAMDKRTGRDV